MAWRQLHDDVPHSKTLGRLSSDAERLYFRMLSQTDQWGRLTGDPDKIRTVCIPTLPWDDDRLYAALAELERAAVDRYASDGVWVTQILNFDARQSFAKQRRQSSRFPDRNLSSLSPSDLALSLPLPADGGLEACDLSLSHGDLRDAVPKVPASTGEHRQKTETEKTEESGLPTAVARAPGADLSIHESVQASIRDSLGLAKDDLRFLVRRLRDADDGTLNTLAKMRAKHRLPPAAFISAFESLEERKQRKPPLRSDVRYVVGALKTMVREGTYARREEAA